MQMVRALICALALLMFSPCWAGPWTNYRSDAAHTANTRENFDPTTLVPQWNRHVGVVQGLPPFSPIVWRQRVFICSVTQNGWFLDSLDLKTGELLWQQPIVSFPYGPVVAGGRLLVAGSDPLPHIDAYAAHDGSFLWTSGPLGPLTPLNSTPVVLGDLVYQAINGSIHALDVSSGLEVWSQDVRGGTHGTPSVSSDGQIFATYPMHYYALSSYTGSLVWHISLPGVGGGGTTPTVGDLVYMVDRDWSVSGYPPTVYALTRETGETIWQRSYRLSLISDTALDRNGLYLTIRPNGATGTLHVLDPDTGTELWEFEPDTSLFYAPVLTKQHVFVSSFSKTYAVDTSTGQEVWSADQGGQVVIANRWVLISTDDGDIHAYRADLSRTRP